MHSPTPVPTGLNATGVSASQINLSWNASSGATGYNIKRSTTPGGPYTAIATGVPVTSYSNTGLTPGTIYYYIVTAIDSSSESGISSQASAITAPGAPSGLTATEGDTQVLLNWSAVAGATSYNVKRAITSGGPYSTLATGVVAPSYTSTGLANGTTYYYVVSAVNTAGQGSNSNQAGATPLALLSQGRPATASSTEGGRSPSHANDGNLSTRWTASGGGYPQWWKVDLGKVQTINKAVILWESSASRSYKYLIEISDNDVTYTTLVDQSARTATGDSTETFSATARYVRITVTGSSGGWAAFYECYIYGIEGFQPTPPNAPTSLAATAISSSRIDLNWTASSGATSYNVKRAAGTGGPYSNIATGITTLNYSDTTSSSGTTYSYVVSAVNGVGEGAESSQAGATTFPGAPTGLTATPGNTQATLNWIATTGADSYTVKRATMSGGPYTSIASGVTTPNHIDTGLSNGTIYYYVISAMNATGEGANSAQVDVTPDVVPTLISQGQPVTASSNEGGNVPENGNDGNAGTRWTASSGTYPQWWKVDLGEIQSINQVNISWLDASRSYKYLIEISDDDATYTTVVNQSARTATGDSSNMMSEWGRYVRITVTGTTAGWAAFYECGILGGLPSAAPLDVTTTAVGSDQIDLSWTASSGAASYNVKRATTSGGPYTMIATGVTGASYSDRGLGTGVTYHYVVSAVNSRGEGADSLQASATTPTPNPMTVEITIANDHRSCVLSWPSRSGWSYRVWTSTDLLTWLAVEAKAGTGKNLEYNYTSLSNDPARFWRVESKEGSF